MLVWEDEVKPSNLHRAISAQRIEQAGKDFPVDDDVEAFDLVELLGRGEGDGDDDPGRNGVSGLDACRHRQERERGQ